MSREDALGAGTGVAGGARTAMLAAVRSLELSSARALINCGHASAPRRVHWYSLYAVRSSTGLV